MQRERRVTKRERKAEKAITKDPIDPTAHIHCVACGRHLDADEFTARPATAVQLICQHKTKFAACAGCARKAKELLEEHDRTGNAVQSVGAWH